MTQARLLVKEYIEARGGLGSLSRDEKKALAEGIVKKMKDRRQAKRIYGRQEKAWREMATDVVKDMKTVLKNIGVRTEASGNESIAALENALKNATMLRNNIRGAMLWD